jgi:hypothetical protein
MLDQTTRRYNPEDNILHDSLYFAPEDLYLDYTSYEHVGEVVGRARGTTTTCLPVRNVSHQRVSIYFHLIRAH